MEPPHKRQLHFTKLSGKIIAEGIDASNVTLCASLICSFISWYARRLVFSPTHLQGAHWNAWPLWWDST